MVCFPTEGLQVPQNNTLVSAPLLNLSDKEFTGTHELVVTRNHCVVFWLVLADRDFFSCAACV